MDRLIAAAAWNEQEIQEFYKKVGRPLPKVAN